MRTKDMKKRSQTTNAEKLWLNPIEKVDETRKYAGSILGTSERPSVRLFVPLSCLESSVFAGNCSVRFLSEYGKLSVVVVS